MYRGLTSGYAKLALDKFGYNELKQSNNSGPLKILLRQIKSNSVIYLLLAALIISFSIGKTATAYTILGVIIIVISVSFIQEYKAEKSIDALKKMITQRSIVIRDGKEIEIDTREIVPGDVVVLRIGEKIPADCIILEEKELRVDESTLTGESKDIKKQSAKNVTPSPTPETTIYMGTFIITGKCIAKVIHTGMNTKFGSIAGLISSTEKELPLQKKVNNIIHQLVILAISAAIITGIIMLLRAMPLSYSQGIDILIVVLALAIAAFPEGFPVVLIATLATGVHRIAKKNAIINRMSIIETLGETTVICSDKTGTITTGQMTVKKLYINDKIIDITGVGYHGNGEFYYKHKKIDIRKDYDIQKILHTSIFCNDTTIERTGESEEYLVKGSSTEGALIILASKAKLYREDLKYSILEEIPFSSERKIMSVVIEENNAKSVHVKGAPEIVLNKCTHILKNGKIRPLNILERKKILDTIHEFSTNSFRSIALAYKDVKKYSIKDIETKLVFLGVAGLEDPPRPEVREAIALCNEAGIKVKMITGDNPETARAIALEIGLEGEILTGVQIDELSNDELSKIVNDIAIFARVRPEHKLRIVHALKANGEIVTMTGDGVNDAPALKEAHIGVAMGKNGTDVSREASDLILKDDHFATIVDAIKEGRTMFKNIQKFTAYQISINITQVLLIMISILIGLPIPLIAIQILFMNIISDEITAISLSFNPYAKDIMSVPPRKKSEILTREIIVFLIVAGILMSLGAIGLFYFMINVMNAELAVARTTVFLIMSLFAVANAFNFRSFRKATLTRSPFVNNYLFYASLISIFSAILITYTPINKIFELVPIGLTEWILAIIITILFIVIMDTLKITNNKYKILEGIFSKLN
ncbi:MAG: cation-translocating P-type ATPase [Candidatus Woesearchaeota archaeon]